MSIEHSSSPPPCSREVFYQRVRKEYAQRYPSFDPASMGILFNLVQTHQRIETVLSSRLHAEEMTFPGLNVLIILRHYGNEGCPLNRLSSLQLVTRANITGVVDHLVRKSFVTRQGQSDDRRIVRARITPKGEKWLDGYLPGHYAAIRELLSGLNRREKTELTGLLSKLKQTSCRHPQEFFKEEGN